MCGKTETLDTKIFKQLSSIARKVITMKNNLETMTRIGKTAGKLAIAGGLLLGIMGCEGKLTRSTAPDAVIKEQKVRSVDETVKEETLTGAISIKGQPVAAEYIPSHAPYLALVIKGQNNAYILANLSSNAARTMVNAAALVQSEINDGDTDEITLTGKYDGTTFIMKSVWVQGYQIDF